MYPQTHFLFSFFVGLIFVKLGVFDLRVAFLVAVVGLFIDIDHYLIFVFKRKNMSFKDAWNKSVKGVYHGRSFIHHWLGFVIMTLVVAGLYFFNKNLFWVFGLGYYSHMFLDYSHLNFLKIKGKIKVKEFGFVEKISKFEVLFDIFLVVALVLLIL